jgi:3-deoxy-D-manno-octulosonic-acid transferase
MRPPAVPLLARAKWAAFRLLERLSDLRGSVTAERLELPTVAERRRSVWVFISTIGELNAIDPFLKRLAERTAPLRLVLITDHPHYRAAYEARYPQAVVCVTRGHSRDARALARDCPPALLVVAEIPCLPSDAPCRFSVSFLLEARRHGARAVLVNGWLYHYAPACRMDAVERRLFQRDYLRGFDAICAQTDETRTALIAAGAAPARVAVAGNIKFDAMGRAQWQVDQARSPALLGALLASARPTVVAGCVTSAGEQQAVLAAFKLLRTAAPDALLVLAPRHPENAEAMQSLREVLAGHGVAATYRSAHGDRPLPDDVVCLVLDTVGDLRDFYAAATVAHVGVDHNVLEALAFDRPVSVMPGWNPTYPSYPVYRLLSGAGALLEAADAEGLQQHWSRTLNAGRGGSFARIDATLARLRGAVDRHFAIIEPQLEVLAP